MALTVVVAAFARRSPCGGFYIAYSLGVALTVVVAAFARWVERNDA